MMDGIAIKRVLWLLVLAAGVLSCSETADRQSRSPNIVLILADDMGIGDVGAYNPGSKIPTPHIDRLAAEGMRFTDAHSAGTWCVPSRYGLLTGQYPMRANLNWTEESIIDSSRMTLATLLKQRGYHTGMVGKWHQGFNKDSSWAAFDFSRPIPGGPVDRGFGYYFGIPASLDIPPYFYIKNDRVVQAPTHSISASHTEGATSKVSGEFWRAGNIAPDFKHREVLNKIRDQSLAFLEKQVSGSLQPFFLYMALTAPHTPWVPSSKFRGKSGAGLYGDFTMQVDQVVGQVVRKLEELGIRENTLILFTSDNGPLWFEDDKEKFHHRSAYIYRGMKGDAWEGGHRVPLIASWPGHTRKGSQSDAIISFTDFMATFKALTGTKEAKTPTDSYNFLPVLLGEGSTARTQLVVGDKTIRHNEWKLIMGNGMGGIHRHYGTSSDTLQPEGALYNLANDPSEQHNLYREKPQKVQSLRQRFEAIKNRKNDNN